MYAMYEWHSYKFSILNVIILFNDKNLKSAVFVFDKFQ